MNCAIATRFSTIADTSRVRLLLSVSLVVGLIPSIPARGGTHGRIHAKKAAHSNRHHKEKHAGKPAAPPPLPVTTLVPIPTTAPPPATPALRLGPAPSARPAPAPATMSVAGAAQQPSPAEPASSIEDQIFCLTNQAREANDLGVLTLDEGLTLAAQLQASAMAQLDVLSHNLPGMPQPTLLSRLQFVGYDYSWAAENIAFGASDAPSVFALWMSSPPHQENILSPSATATGVGVAYDSQGFLYFSQVFGEPR